MPLYVLLIYWVLLSSTPSVYHQSFIKIDRKMYFTYGHKLLSVHYTANWLYWERNNFTLNFAGNLMKQSHAYTRWHNKHPHKQNWIVPTHLRSMPLWKWLHFHQNCVLVFLKCMLKCPLTVCRCHDWSKCCVNTILVSCYLHSYILMKMYTMTVQGISFYTPARLCTEQTYRLPTTHLSLKLVVPLLKSLLAQQFLPERYFSLMLSML